jgi:hypothetical protein
MSNQTELIPTQYPLYDFTSPIGSNEPVHTFRIGENGSVEGYEFETYYYPAEKVIDYGDFIGFVCDDGTDGFVETRVPVSILLQVLGRGSIKTEGLTREEAYNLHLMQLSEELAKKYEAENQRLREALAFYENEENYWPCPAFNNIGSAVVLDHGERARKALEGQKWWHTNAPRF